MRSSEGNQRAVAPAQAWRLSSRLRPCGLALPNMEEAAGMSLSRLIGIHSTNFNPLGPRWTQAARGKYTGAEQLDENEYTCRSEKYGTTA